MANLLPNDTREFVSLGDGIKYNSFVTPPSFKPDGMLADKSALERKARFQASAEMLFKTDLSKLDDIGVSGLYQCVTEGMFGLKDTDGQMAFGKRASKNMRENIDMLRRFVKGDYTLIEDPEYTKWREMDEEGKFRYALENEPKANKVKSHLKGERGASPWEVMFKGLAANPPSSVPGMARAFRPAEVNDEMDKQYADSARRLHYDSLTDEEKASYRADVIGDYEKKLSRRQTLATYLQFASNLSDKAAYYLAESFQKGRPDINVEFLDPEERDRVYSAFSLMRGDQKRGRILGIFNTDFTDDTVANRIQMGLYGFQQSVVGLVTDTGDMVRDGAMWAYAKTTMDDAERKAFFEGWDATVRAERAMEQALPEAEGWFGAGFQGLMENVHWFIPYGAIGKGGKMMSAASKTASRAKLQKEVFTGAKALAEMNAATAKTRWLADVQGAVKAGKGAKKVNEFASAVAMRRELAAVERYTKALEAIPGITKAAKVRDAAGAALWTVGEASALSAFASEYVAAADAAGVSREESMITAWAIGLVNARIERLYVAGLESSLTASQIKALTFKALYNAVKSDGAAGFRKWFVNRVQRGAIEGSKITATEGLIEEPLQQLATEHAKAFDKLCAEMREKGETDLADKAQALWQSFAKQLPEDYGIFVDTVVDSFPTSLAFGVTGVGNMTRRQHLHNVMTRHMNRRAGSTSTMLTAKNGQELMGAVDYDAGVVDIIQQGVNTRAAMEKYWKGDKSDEAKNPNRFEEAITAARRAFRNPQTRDVVQEVAEAAGVDVKTAEVVTQYLQNEAEMAAFSPQARAFTSLHMSLADIDETTIKTVLPGYVEGSFAADAENGIYSGRVKLGDGTERTIAYRVGDISEMLREQVEENSKVDSSFGVSFDAKQEELGTGITWASLSDAQRYSAALTASNAFRASKSGVFELTDAKGKKVCVNADDIIYLANGRLGDIGYGPAATMGTARHETFHSLWGFARATMDEEDVQKLAKALGVDVTADGWENKLDEVMAYEFEKYASGHYVSHAVSSCFDKMLDGWAGNVIKFFGSFGPADEVRDPRTGHSFALKDFYDKVLKGELGSGKLGVEVRSVPSVGGGAAPTSGTMPVEVTEADRAAQDAEMRDEVKEVGSDEILTIDPKGMTQDEAKACLDRLKGGEYENSSTLIKARLSSTGAGKLISNAAVSKTVKNGFSPYQHNALAANIDRLFKAATLVEERPDRDGDVNIKSIKRFVCPVRMGEKELAAWITVKESTEHGHRIYSVEGIKIMALSPSVRRVLRNRNSADNAITPHIVSQGSGAAQEATLENPADASVANQIYYRIGLPNSDVKLVGRLEVRDVFSGLVTSTDEDYHDRGNQNRDDTSEESRALVLKIAGRPDPMQVGTVQPMANNGIGWALPNGDVIIGNHRVNGVRAGYEKGTAADLERFVREDAAKRGIEIGEGVKAPLTVFVLERIESPEGQNADVHEVVRLANESQNRGFNIREQAGNDAKILIDNNLLPRMQFRADGRIDETKCADAIGKFRRESGAQGLVGEDGMLTEDGLTRIQNAALAALLGGTGNSALLQKIMENAKRLDMQSQLRALMKVTPELMAIAQTKPDYDLRPALGEALQLFTEWRDKDEEKRLEKGKSKHDWRELDKDGKRKRGISWETFMSQGDMFRQPPEEVRILGDLFAKTEQLRSFDREDIESAAGKKRVIDLITDYLTDYAENVRAVNTETEDMFGSAPASLAEVLAAQRAKGENGPRFSIGMGTRNAVRDFAQGKDSFIENEYGKIAYDFGKPGHITPGGKVKGGHGILHIVYSRMVKDGVSLAEAVNTAIMVADAIETGKETLSIKNKKYFRKGDIEGIFADNGDGKLVLTGYKIIADGSEGASLVSSDLRTQPPPRKEEVVAALNDWMNRHPTPHNIPQSAAWRNTRFSVNPNLRVLNEAADASNVRFSIGGIFTGSAADYANRSREGGKDDGPSLIHVGSGEGSQVYGWGLYGSNVRGVAKHYAGMAAAGNFTLKRNGQDVPRRHNLKTPENLAEYTIWAEDGDIKKAIASLKKKQAIYLKNGYFDNVTYEAIEHLRKHGKEYEFKPGTEHLYEQTFFTDRAPGDESHLLKWYEPVSEEQKSLLNELGVTTKALDGVENYYRDGKLVGVPMKRGVLLGGDLYTIVAKSLGSPKAASEFLARAGIDGVKYPVDSYGTTVKDGDEVGWNYVSFRDDNIRVDHKWVDGEQRFSIATLGKYRTDDLRSLAHRVKDGDAEAIAEAGRRLAVILPPDAVLVPMPSHTGEPTTMRLLADAIAANANGAKVVDALRSNAHESNYAQKKRGEEPAEIEMRKVADIPENAEVYIVDNVIDTGATYSAAMKAIPNAHILALADTDRTPEELRSTFKQNIDKILSRFDEAKGLSKEDIFKKFDNTNLEIGSLPNDLHLPQELSVVKRTVKAAEAYVLDHLHNKPHHAQVLTADDARRMLSLINPNNEMRIVPQRSSSSLAFIAANPSGGWDCVVIAPRRGEFYVFKTMFAQKRKPYQDKSQIRYSIGLAERGNAVGSLIRGLLTSIRDIDQVAHIISNSLSENNGPSAELLEAMAASASEKRKNEEKNKDKRKYSVAAEPSPLFKSVAQMSDDELITAAVAVRMALGKSEKFSDRAVKINTVQNIMRRLHPEYKTGDVGRESLRVISDARKFAKKIREDIDRGVSDSLILEHLPQTAREQFGREMVEEARRGQRLGRFGQKVASKLEDRQARIVEDAVRVQTGMDVSLMENLYGVNLSETLMHLAENPLTEKPLASAAGAGEGETVEGEEAAGEETEPVDVSAAVQAAVNEIVGTAKTATDANERNRADRRAAAGRDAERAAELDGEDATGGGAGDDFGGEDIVAIATKKAGLDLENPRHLAEFVAELTRRYWIKEHELGQNAEVWRDLVAVQFLRKTAQGIYAKLCKDLTYSRSRETAMQHIAKLDHVPTVQGLLSEMEFVGALINAQRIRDTQKALCEKLDLFLRQKFGAQGRFKPDKEEGKRNVSAEAELRARYMRHAMWLTPDAAADEARELQEKLDLLAVEFTDAGRDRDQSREFVETIRKLNVLREFGALRYKPVGEIEAAAKWWEDFERGESDDIVREMSDRDIRTKKAAELLAKAFADPKRVTVREGATTADRINKFLTGHMGFVALLNDCMRHASDADRAAVKDIIGYIQREIQKAGDGTATEKRHHNDAFHAAVESIYGKGFNKVMKEMMAEDERFLKFMGEVGGKRDIPTKGRAMQLLVSLLQEGRKVEVEDEENPGKTKVIYEGGYHDNIVKHKREGQAAELMKLMSPADMNMIKWLGMWYEQNRQDLSRVCHSLFGIGVYAELPNYFPVKMRLDKQGLEKGAAVGWTIFPKALTPRVKNERDFDTSADIFQMWSSRMEEGAQWKHHAQLGLEMRGIFGRAELQGAVISNHGEATNALMQGFITDVLAGKGAVDRSTGDVQYISDKIRGWTALCALGGNVGVMLKQTTSIPAFGFEIGLVDTARHIVSAFTPEGLAAMGKIWQSEQRKTRWDVGNSEAVANALNKQDAGWLKRAFQASMITNKLGDVVPALVVGQGVYRDCIARGMSEADAMAETWMLVERTQQSSRMENLASVQRRNRVGRIMFQFMSTQRQYLDYELRAIREVIAQPSSVGRWKKLGTTILLNHFILTSAYYWMGQLYKAMLGQEPPEDELTDWVITCLLGPYGSLFVAGFCCNYTLQRALKGYSYGGGSSMLPMESWLKNQVNDGTKLVEAIFDSEGDTWDNMLDAAGKWMSDSNSLFRDLRKIYRFRIKDEPQKKRK